MGLIPARCTQCGAEIEVDASQEAGICKHCGTPFITEKVINNYNTYVKNDFSGATVIMQNKDVSNYLNLAMMEYEEKSYDAADRHCTEALEIDASCWQAYLIEMKIETNWLIQEERHRTENKWFFSNANKALKFAPSENQMEVKIAYAAALVALALKFFAEANHRVRNYCNSIDEKDGVHFDDDPNGTDMDFDYLYKIAVTPKGVEYLFIKFFETWETYLSKVPKEALPYEPSMIENYKYCVDFYYGSVNRVRNGITRHNLDFAAEDKQALRQLWNKLIENVPEACLSGVTKDILPERTVSNNGQTQACYIATCAYGTYDCPEVWTLRRYRDYVLDSTWYGRLFIKCYYMVGPIIVKYFGNISWLKQFVRKKLDLFVRKLNMMGLENTKYDDKY